jgi:membrane protein DedA with SNARE-associated domain
MLLPEHLHWLSHCVVIFFMTFLHEDAAILAAAFSTVEHKLPLWMAYSSVYLGIVTGDLLIYGLGHMAQKNKWLRSRIIGPKVERVQLWLESHLVRVLVLCRITPGLLFPTFVACGWFRIPLSRFATVSILAGAIYSSVVLTLIILFGDLVLNNLGYWAWGVLAIVIVGFAVRNSFKSRWSKTTEKAMGYLPPSFFSVFKKYMPALKNKFHGMPSLDDLKRRVSVAEHIPNNILYIPVGLYYLFLSFRYRSLTLPSASNPNIETGGFMGESKGSVMNQVGKEQQPWIAEFVSLHRDGLPSETDLENALALMRNKDLDFPVVAKPDIGWNGYGVRLIEDKNHLHQYISAFPHDEKIILQRPVPYDGEAGIFYVRIPGESNGKIYSITLRYFPFVTGDGKSTLRELISNDRRTKLRAGFYLGDKREHVGFADEDLDHVPEEGELVRLSFIGSLRVGGLYRNASHLITPELSQRFDKIALSMPEFYFGRFDIRFESVDSLKKGEGFSVIEINGAGAEAIQAWDPNVPLFKLYREFFKSYKLLFKIGNLNRARGYNPMTLKEFIRAVRHQNRLIEQYPPAG